MRNIFLFIGEKIHVGASKDHEPSCRTYWGMHIAMQNHWESIEWGTYYCMSDIEFVILDMIYDFFSFYQLVHWQVSGQILLQIISIDIGSNNIYCIKSKSYIKYFPWDCDNPWKYNYIILIQIRHVSTFLIQNNKDSQLFLLLSKVHSNNR